MRDFLCKDLSGTSSEIPIFVPADACLILQYNRVASLCFDPLQLAVEPYNFEGQIEYLARNFNVISMDQMKEHLEMSRPFEDRTVVITFDGGFTDVLYTAKDVLDRFEVPATVFASSANILKGRRMWWKKLEDFLIANPWEGRLDLEIDGRFRRWALSTQHDRFRAYDELYLILSDKTPHEQEAIIEQIAASMDLLAEEFDDHRTMTAEELRQITKGGAITVGGYTHSYVKLSCLPMSRQLEEILQNKEILQEVLGCDIDYFAYPFGNDGGYTPETMQILRDVGFSLACGGAYGAVSAGSGSSFYELPRVKVGNWSAFTFYRFLRRFFE